MHKVFISYHHKNDQLYKDELADMATRHGIFIDGSVDTGDISDDYDDQRIREIIRDEYLRDTTVTIVLVGAETRGRKHVDWEVSSSMFDGKVNKKSGILVIALPTVGTGYGIIHASHGDEERKLYPGVPWTPVLSWEQYQRACPSLPDRILDNMVSTEAMISVTPWNRIEASHQCLRTLIELAFRDRKKCKYDNSLPLRRANS